jgi:hypothetical protein
LKELQKLLRALENDIFNLKLTQLPSHLPVAVLFKFLRNLTTLSITYGARHLGSKYERVAFGITILDATNIEDCIRISKTLVSLGLPGNMIDKDILQRMMKSLVLNTSITQLDLSHNILGDIGARRISKYIKHSKILTHLNLCDNNVISQKLAKFCRSIMKDQDGLLKS